ncbi:helix-turn-helix transcriptional regulator [Endozoicomonas sp. 2B-B]
MQAKEFLNVKEVKDRYGFSSSVTLYNWRKKKGFPNPISGRYYSLEKIKKWEEEQGRV